MSQLITKSVAQSLHQSLMERRSFSDWHDLGSYDGALSVIGEAGLGAILLPMRPSKRSKQWDVMLAVVDAKPGTRFSVEPKDDKPAKVYCMTKLTPMTNYVGELMTCNLEKPWWAANNFFSAIANLISPGYMQYVDHSGGRSGWGHQTRTGFDRRFKEIWLDGEHEPKPLEPSVVINTDLIRFASCPVLPVMAEASLERQAAPVPVPSDTRYEFSVYDWDYTEQAGGSAPTYAQALSEGQSYLAQYQQDGPHTLEVRRVENLNPGAFPVPDDAPLPLLPEDAQVIEPTKHTILVPARVPVAVSERLPQPEDCDAEGRCWLLTVEDEYPQWRLHSIEGSQPGGDTMMWVPVDSSPGVMVDCFYTSHWLPAYALPLPTTEHQP